MGVYGTREYVVSIRKLECIWAREKKNKIKALEIKDCIIEQPLQHTAYLPAMHIWIWLVSDSYVFWPWFRRKEVVSHVQNFHVINVCMSGKPSRIDENDWFFSFNSIFGSFPFSFICLGLKLIHDDNFMVM